ncbi:MAG: hypothetical protein J5U19_14035 [Candidatus Methanoperedens sp.]|nr:hypothetical protein [Candidatus Methanoperedens sp.]
MQIDFLSLLNNFVEISVKTIKLENAVFDLKETIMDRRRLTNSVTDEMDNFIMYAEKSKEFLKKYSKTKFTEEILQEITQFEKKIEEADEENRKLLESFFIYDPIPLIGKKYTIKATGQEMKYILRNLRSGRISIE